MTDRLEDCVQSFRTLEELYRCERVFLLQPERVTLDDRFRQLIADSHRLGAFLSKTSSREISVEFAARLKQHRRLIEEFTALLEEAGKINIYSNYRANS